VKGYVETDFYNSPKYYSGKRNFFWKVHIIALDGVEYVPMIKGLLPYLQSQKITHKIIKLHFWKRDYPEYGIKRGWGPFDPARAFTLYFTSEEQFEKVKNEIDELLLGWGFRKREDLIKKACLFYDKVYFAIPKNSIFYPKRVGKSGRLTQRYEVMVKEDKIEECYEKIKRLIKSSRSPTDFLNKIRETIVNNAVDKKVVNDYLKTPKENFKKVVKKIYMTKKCSFRDYYELIYIS